VKLQTGATLVEHVFVAGKKNIFPVVHERS
jgi:hypothetical protein